MKRKNKKTLVSDNSSKTVSLSFLSSSSNSGRTGLIEQSRLIYLAVVCLFLIGALLGIRQISSPDLGFHLSSAKWIIENKAIPDTDIFTFTVTDHNYTDLQWMFQLVVYAFNNLWGPAGITFLTTVLTLVFGAVLLLRTYRSCKRIPMSAVFFLGLFFLGNFWEIRPHIFSWILGSIVLFILEENQRGTSKYLPLMPLLMLIWVNVHSLFILGFVIIGTYVFADIVTNFWTHQKLILNKKLLLCSIAAVLICLANPYHIRGIQFPITQFFMLHADSYFNSPDSGVAELVSPFRFQQFIIDGRLVPFQPILAMQIFAVFAFIATIGMFKRVKLAQWILFAGFFYIFFNANKNFGYFVMVSFPAICFGLDNVLARLRNVPNQYSTKTPMFLMPNFLKSPLVSYILTISIFFLCFVAIVTSWIHEIGWQENDFGTGFNQQALPTRACDFINDNNIEGRILNCWNDGGYIGWSTKQKVFINSIGELIGLDFYDKYIEARQPEGFQRLLTEYKPTVAVIRYRITPYWLFYLSNIADDWRMVYSDCQVAVFLHSSVSAEIPALPDPKPGKDYNTYDTNQMLNIVDSVCKTPKLSFFERLKGSRAYPLEQMQLSSFYLHTNQPDVCISTCLEGLKKASFIVPDLMLNLGHALNANKNYALADKCYDAFLSVDNDPVLSQEIKLQRQRRR